MSVSVNWQPIVGGLLLTAGVVVAAVQWWRNRPHAAQTDQPVVAPSVPKPLLPRKITELDDVFEIDAKKQDAKPKKRRADDPAPPGAVEWVADVSGAIDGAPAELILGVLKAGGSRESALIAEREARKPAEPAA